MIIDGANAFEPVAGTAITVSAASANSIDLGTGLDAANALNHPLLVVHVLTGFASATPTATLTFQTQMAPDNGGVPGNWITVDSSAAIPLARLQAGMRPYREPLPLVSEALQASTVVTGTFSCSAAASTISVASATNLLDGLFMASPGVLVPGTQITGISGTTISISPNTAAAAAAGTAFAATGALSTGAGVTKLPRYVRLSYVCSATFTAGTIFAGIVGDVDANALYPAGFTIPVGVAA